MIEFRGSPRLLADAKRVGLIGRFHWHMSATRQADALIKPRPFQMYQISVAVGRTCEFHLDCAVARLVDKRSSINLLQSGFKKKTLMSNDRLSCGSLGRG
jgi:hypothetical protein